MAVLPASAAALVLLLGATPAAAVLPTADPPVETSLVWALPWSEEILGNTDDGGLRVLTYEAWARRGFPAPSPPPTPGYVRYPWSPSVSALIQFDPTVPSTYYWDVLTEREWQHVGSPDVTVTSYVGGSIFYRWGTSDEVFVRDPGGYVHHLTPTELRQAGYGSDEIHMRDTEGYARLSWDPSVARMTDLATGQGRPITWDQWRLQDFPTPAVQDRFPGDQLYRHAGDPTVWYAGPTVHRPVTWAEWQALGAPAPTVLEG